MGFSAVIVAAGSSTRAGPGAPKPWRSLGGRPILLWSVEAFAAAGARQIVVVVADGWTNEAADLLRHIDNSAAVRGGATRAESVQAGLKALTGPADMPVLVHDAARPLLTGDHVKALLAALADADGAVPALPMADTLKRGAEGLISETVPRDGLWRAQTPQAFRLASLLSAYAAWPADAEPTDDAAVVEKAGGRVAMTPGDPRLMK
ncbi:MAG: 2-C-methyl-D-erythritol 4-phosphate cytidylyltransferase, partial [Phenylobacterium sp.]